MAGLSRPIDHGGSGFPAFSQEIGIPVARFRTFLISAVNSDFPRSVGSVTTHGPSTAWPEDKRGDGAPSSSEA